MILYKGLFIVLLLFVSKMSNANDTIPRMTLEECIKKALDNNYVLKQSQLDEVIAKDKTKELKANLLPQINASTSLMDNISSPVVILPGELLGMANMDIPVELVTPYELGARIELNQIIFDATLFTGIKTARNVEELIKLKGEFNKEELIYNIGMAFYDILYSEQLLDNLISNLNMQDSLYLYMSHRKNQDLIREIDLNRIKVQIKNIRVHKNQLIAKIDQQKRYLKILIGISDAEALFLDSSELKNINSPIDLIEGQINEFSSKELAILNKQRMLEQLTIKSINSQYIPTLSFVASGGYLFQSDNLKLTNSDLWFDYSFIGIRFNIPIFDGLKKQKQRRQIKLKIEKIDEEIKFTKNKIITSYENAMQLMRVGYQAISAQEDNLGLAKKINEQSILLYKEGLHSTTDLLQTNAALQEAQGAYWLEIINYKKAELELMRAKGILNNLNSFKR